MNILKKDCVVLVALLVVSSCFFYYVNSQVKPFNEWDSLKYSTPDSTTYLNVGKWLLGLANFDDVKSSLAIRPFFYPLIVTSLESIHPWSIWMFQFILWQTQILMIYISCVKISNSRFLAFFIALTSISIISPIGIALHALTETVSSFFITSSVFMLTLNLYKKSYINILICLLSLSLCSVVRPSILYIYLFLTAVISFNLKSRKLVHIFLLAITVIPILAQDIGMKKYFDTYRISFIDTFAINDYFLSGLELYKRNLEKDVNKNQYIRMIRDARRRYMAEMIAKEGYKKTSENVRKDFLANLTSYPLETFLQFKDLIIENSIQSSSFLAVDNKNINKLFYIVTLSQSKLLLTINIVSILFFLMILFLTKIVKKTFIQNEYIIYSSLILFSICFTYLSTGITFWQGDRFIIPIYYISIILFTFQIKIFFEAAKQLSRCKLKKGENCK